MVLHMAADRMSRGPLISGLHEAVGKALLPTLTEMRVSGLRPLGVMRHKTLGHAVDLKIFNLGRCLPSRLERESCRILFPKVEYYPLIRPQLITI